MAVAITKDRPMSARMAAQSTANRVGTKTSCSTNIIVKLSANIFPLVGKEEKCLSVEGGSTSFVGSPVAVDVSNPNAVINRFIR